MRQKHHDKALSIRPRRQTVFALAAAMLAVFGLEGARAATIFEHNEGGPGRGVLNPVLTSFHNTVGPVLADDFVPAAGGRVNSVTWWGSQANATDVWEVTFHGNSAANDPGFPVISQHFVSGVSGVDPDGDGVFEFTADWTPQDTSLAAGAQFWFSVANGRAGWQWALAGLAGPQVGAENFSALESVGGAPSIVAGPHDGPWALPTCPVCGAGIDADLAFRISAVPAPAALPLLASGLGVMGFFGWRRRNRA